jgi:transcriptional regulator with XRE-family HTH domain
MAVIGAFFREKRLKANLSLRKFCELAHLDPSNWSKVERGRLAPPDRGKLEEIAKVLGLEKEEYLELFDLASIEKGKIPDYVYSDAEILKALPIFFRTANGSKPTKEELEKIIELLKSR